MPRTIRVNISHDPNYRIFVYNNDYDFDTKIKNYIHPGDKLSLIPYGIIAPEDTEMFTTKYNNNNYKIFILDFIKRKNNKYIIDIDPEHNSYFDLVCLFNLYSKKVKYDEYQSTIYDSHFTGSDILVFNNSLVKVGNCWFLEFDH